MKGTAMACVVHEFRSGPFGRSAVGSVRACAARGFSLIELMAVVAIVGIVAAIALPSYQSHMLKSRRSDAYTALAQAQGGLERCYAQNFSYASTNCSFPSTANSPQGYYTVAYAISSATTYTVTATPIGVQASDTTCAKLVVDQTGAKTATDASGNDTSSTCWNP